MAFPETITHDTEQTVIEPITWQPVCDDASRKDLTLENFKLYSFNFETPDTFDLGKYVFKIPANSHLTVYDFSQEEGKFIFELKFLDGSEDDLTFDIVNGVYSIQDRGKRFFEEKDVQFTVN